MKQPAQTTRKGKTAKTPQPAKAKDITAPAPEVRKAPETAAKAPPAAEQSKQAQSSPATGEPAVKPGKAAVEDNWSKATEPRPMPKDFTLKTVREGSRVVARQDGIEVPFEHTDDKDEYASREQTQREAMWAELERRRIRGLQK